MGVNKLWHLLQASGRTLQLSQLRGATVAIDVSIWMIRIIHGMANAGVQNFSKGHLIGILKRIIYMMENGVKPVFVFDGPPPALKQNTLKYRQAQRNRSMVNLQKLAERYVVKLMEKGVNIEQQEQIDDGDIFEMIEQEESESNQFTQNEEDLDPEIKEIRDQQRHEIINLEYNMLKNNHPDHVNMDFDDFQMLDYDQKVLVLENIEESINTNHHKLSQDYNPTKLSNRLLQSYIQNAQIKDKIRQVKWEAMQQIQNLKIQRLLDKYDDDESKMLKDYLLNNPEAQIQLHNINRNDIYIQLSDPNERKKLLDMINKQKKKKKKKLKDYQIENIQLDKLREKIKRRYETRQEDFDLQSDYEIDQNNNTTNKDYHGLSEKYDVYNTKDVADNLRMLANLIDEDDDQQQSHQPTPIRLSKRSPTPSQIKRSPSPHSLQQNEKEQALTREEKLPYEQIIVESSEEEDSSELDIEEEERIMVAQQQNRRNITTQNDPKDQNDANDANDIFIKETKPTCEVIIAQEPTSNIEFSQKQNIIFSAPIQKPQTPHQAQQNKTPMKESQAQISQQKKELNMTIEKILDEITLDENISTDEMLHNIQKFQNLSTVDMQSKFEEVKYLLTIFGIPWVEAPGESEAQCAKLEELQLVDFVVTDDSDAFLFGAQKVVKGLFDKRQNVEYYGSDQLESELGLSREKLIFLALFLGSDYTEGIKGVGIVNAIEIVEAFDSIDALRRFARWASKADVLLENAQLHYENIPEKERIYKEFHKNYKKYWELPANFPSLEVIEAYLNPKVDDSKEQFKFGQPSLPDIERFCLDVLEWEQEIVENNVMVPLRQIIEYNKQPKITDYFRPQLNAKVAFINSRRIQTAVSNLMNPTNSRQQIQSKQNRKILDDIILQGEKRKKTIREKKKKEVVANQQQNVIPSNQVDGDGDVEIQNYQFVKKRKTKRNS